jgi:hypothetical protein
MTRIHLGYEVGTGEPIEIPLRHTAVTGQTQESGKTTTLEGLIARSGLKAVAYVTKRGESSFRVMNPIAPYFLERADWKFVQSLLEAAMETRMDFKQAWIMRASDGAKTLLEVRANIYKFLHGVRDPLAMKHKNRGKEQKERWITKPARGLNADVYYVLDKYFEEIMPQLDQMPYSTKLELAPCLNVMDLREYEFPLQALVVRSVIDWVHDHGHDTINVIPEAWKFAPKQKGSPVRQSAEEMVREGAAMQNFLWIDSQDLAGVADVLMRQVGVWLFGVQRAKHEIERALDHMPEGLPVRRPRPQDIATLSKGQFYVCFGREMHKVYVQPAWMAGAHAEAIARGEEEVDSARDILMDFDRRAYRAAQVPPLAPVVGGKMGEFMQKFPVESLEATYQYIRKRLREEDPKDLLSLLTLPEMHVKIERPVITANGDSLFGRMAQLIKEGFFKEIQGARAATAEAVRRGWCHPKTPFMRVQDPLDKLTGMGFLTRETEGYLAVVGMKIHIEGA